MTGKTREKSAGTGTYGRNLTVRLAAVLGVLLALLGILLFLTPRLANMEPVKNRILDGLSRQIGGTVTCERIALSFFRRPPWRFTISRWPHRKITRGRPGGLPQP